MPFVEPITIKDAINSIHRKKYLLPAIQREFVWDSYQIERLFDSLMRDYPISSFLFWEVEKENINKYQFYEFIREYHERDNTHNPKANINGENGITAILDGQQRLTSLYIGLKGTYADKLPRKRWDNDSAFPKRILCLNLISPSKNNDLKYEFSFLTSSEASQRSDDSYWFPVKDILNIKETYEVNEYLIKNDLSSLEKEKSIFANRTLFKLYDVVHKNKSINFFLEKDEILDKVLNIFIRVNSGGTQLSYSDLLLSVATAQWEEKDAREEITDFVDDVNIIGDGFNINKDFVLKSCLVLSGFKDIAFKVDNFNRSNMLQIEKNWDKISKAIKASIFLASSLGYHRDTLTSNNALIPIAHYLYKINSPDNFHESNKYKNDRKQIFKWLAIALLKRTFSGQPDNILRPIRIVIDKTHDSFPFDEILSKLKSSTKSMIFNDDDIESIFYYQYGQPYTYSALAIIYPSFDFKNKFHQDHIFPKKLFTRKRLEKIKLDEENIEYYMGNYNYLANLQLLSGIPNQEKSGKDFKRWLLDTYPDKEERKAYMKTHYIPDVELSFDNFEEFIEERTKLIIAAFKKILA
jgi:uncharacterized protein with ParB-like and HNH nuclease domain